MQIQFLGATGTVTGSKYLLRQDGASLMIDCGQFQGYKQLRLRNRAPLPVDASELGAPSSSMPTSTTAARGRAGSLQDET